MIVAGVRAAQAQAGGRDGLGGADRFAGEGRRPAGQTDRVAAEHAAERAAGGGGGGSAVINLVVGGDAADHRGFGYVKRSAHRAG